MPKNNTTGKKPEKNVKTAENKSPGQRLADKLFINLKNCWEGIDAKKEKEINAFAKSYREMLDREKPSGNSAPPQWSCSKSRGFRN